MSCAHGLRGESREVLVGQGGRRPWLRDAYCCLSSRAVRALRLVGWTSRSLHPPPRDRSPVQSADREEEEEDPNLPIQFSGSKATPVRWTVEHSLGKQQQRPWWKVLPFTLPLVVLIVWCYRREESSTDQWLRQILEEEDEEEPEGPLEELEAPAIYGART